MAGVYPATIHPAASPRQIRQELSRITQQKNWDEDDWWAFFQAGQRQIFESEYNSLNEEDWLKPETLHYIENAFVDRAEQRWVTPETKWIIAGGWLRDRPDIVRRLRANCWKNFQKKRAGDMTFSGSGNMQAESSPQPRSRLSTTPQSELDPQSQPSSDSWMTTPQAEASGNESADKSWREVVLQGNSGGQDRPWLKGSELP